MEFANDLTSKVMEIVKKVPKRICAYWEWVQIMEINTMRGNLLKCYRMSN